MSDRLPSNLTFEQFAIEGAPAVKSAYSFSRVTTRSASLAAACSRTFVTAWQPTDFTKATSDGSMQPMGVSSHTSLPAMPKSRQLDAWKTLACTPNLLRREQAPTFLEELAKLFSRGVESSASKLEAAITLARRRADRDWAGSTRHDPLVLIRDLPWDVAIALEGTGTARYPRCTRQRRRNRSPLPWLTHPYRHGSHLPLDGYASHTIGWLKKLSSEMDRETALAFGLDPTGWVGDSKAWSTPTTASSKASLGNDNAYGCPQATVSSPAGSANRRLASTSIPLWIWNYNATLKMP